MKKAMTKSKTRARTKVTHPSAATKRKEYRTEEVIKTNGSMELDPNLMHMKTARAIAKSLKHSADRSKRLTHSPFHSALSTLNYLINHVEVQKARLEAAKNELRQLYGEGEARGKRAQPSNSPEDYAHPHGNPKGAGPRLRNGKPVDGRQRNGRQPKSA